MRRTLRALFHDAPVADWVLGVYLLVVLAAAAFLLSVRFEPALRRLGLV